MTANMAFACYSIGYHLGLRLSSKKAVGLPKNFGNIKQVSLGIHHNAFVNSEGAVFTYGNPKFRHLTHNFSKLPVQVDLKNITKVECGDSFTVALDSKGVVHSWGSSGKKTTWSRIVGYRHCLGRKNTDTELVPLPVELSETVTDIKAGRDHCLALTNKNVYAWGSNDFGQQGNTDLFSFNETPKPLKFFSANNEIVVKIEAAGNSSAALTSSGKLYVWGSNEEKNLGLDSESNFLREPNLISLSLIEPVKDFALGINTLMVMLENSDILVSGMNMWKNLKEFYIPWSKQPFQLCCGKDFFAVLAKDGTVAYYGGPFNQTGPDLEIPDNVKIMEKKVIPGKILEITGKYELVAAISMIEDE